MFPQTPDMHFPLGLITTPGWDGEVKLHRLINTHFKETVSQGFWSTDFHHPSGWDFGMGVPKTKCHHMPIAQCPIFIFKIHSILSYSGWTMFIYVPVPGPLGSTTSATSSSSSSPSSSLSTGIHLACFLTLTQILLKGQSHEIKVWFFGALWIEKILGRVLVHYLNDIILNF